MTILVSACLLGCACRYDGKSMPSDEVMALLSRHTLIPVCPELLGGLPTPRLSCERVGDRVLRSDGADMTDAYHKGAEEVLRLGKLFGAKKALLKERSPSCGSGIIHNGKFDGGLVPGFGKTAALLLENGFEVFGESQIEELVK